jgi:pyridoxamine 5'-phosphate oxidase
LEEAGVRFEKEFEGINPARPRYWSGFRLLPLEWEFWADRPHRLHYRVMFKRESPDGIWTKTRLYP